MRHGRIFSFTRCCPWEKNACVSLAYSPLPLHFSFPSLNCLLLNVLRLFEPKFALIGALCAPNLNKSIRKRCKWQKACQQCWRVIGRERRRQRERERERERVETIRAEAAVACADVDDCASSVCECVCECVRVCDCHRVSVAAKVQLNIWSSSGNTAQRPRLPRLWQVISDLCRRARPAL